MATGGTILGLGRPVWSAGFLRPFWFDAGSPVLRYRVTNPSSSTQFQVEDRLYRRDVGAATITDFRWNFSASHHSQNPQTITRSTSNPAVIIPDPDNVLKWIGVSAGTATITLSCTARTVTREVTVQTGPGATVDRFIGFAGNPNPDPGDDPDDDGGSDDPPPAVDPPPPPPVEGETSLRYAIATTIDSRIAGKTPAVALPIFSLQDHTNGLYARNPDCWAADLDLTPISPWNSVGGIYEAGILVSPRHILFATHFQLEVGATVRFVTSNNVVVERTMTAKASLPYVPYYPDITIGVLDSDVPGSISFAKVLPDNWSTKIVTGSALRIPTLTLDQEEKALVTDLQTIGSSPWMYGSSVTFMRPTDATRLAFYEDKISGDSGNPACLVIDGQLVLLCVWTFGGPGAGTGVTAFRSGINTVMTSLGGGYQLTDVDLSAYPDYS